MGTTAEDLRVDIEQTRERLGGTIEAIGDRVSPGRMVERRKNRLVRGWSSFRDRVMGGMDDATHTVQDEAHHAADAIGELPQTVRRQTQGSPMGAGMVAFGVGFVAASLIPASRAEKDAVDKLATTAEPLREKAGEVVDEMRHQMADQLSEVKDDVKEMASGIVQPAADQGVHGGSTASSGTAPAAGSSDFTGQSPTGTSDFTGTQPR
jgi:gas vesicle protein